ncbi:MAG: hypothetical protein ACFFKA_07020 [Candidatus Thorarchaeota archaeon]
MDNRDILFNLASDYIRDFRKSNTGALYDWTKEHAEEFSRIPIETLIRDAYFLGFKDKIYAGVLEDIVELFEERKKRQINLAIFLEGIGSGKTVKASIIEWLLWFELTLCTPTPQEYFDLAPQSVIALINLNRTEKQAKKVTFTEVYARFQSPFNKDYFPPSEKYTSEIRIPRNSTTVFPGTSSALSALGYNLYGGTIDEAAFLEVIDDSTKTYDGKFDAAEEMYNAIINRMISRFLRRGHLPGLLCMISSPNFPDDFLHRQIEYAIRMAHEAKMKSVKNESNIFWRRRPTWEAKGKKFYPEKDFFYIDTENAEIFEDEKVKAFLDNVSEHLFPLKIDPETLLEVCKYVKEAA